MDKKAQSCNILKITFLIIICVVLSLQANKWCTEGVDLLAGQPLDKCNTPEGAEVALKDLEMYLETADDLKLNNPREFRQLFDNMITPETRVSLATSLKANYGLIHTVF